MGNTQSANEEPISTPKRALKNLRKSALLYRDSFEESPHTLLINQYFQMLTSMIRAEVYQRAEEAFREDPECAMDTLMLKIETRKAETVKDVMDRAKAYDCGDLDVKGMIDREFEGTAEEAKLLFNEAPPAQVLELLIIRHQFWTKEAGDDFHMWGKLTGHQFTLDESKDDLLNSLKEALHACFEGLRRPSQGFLDLPHSEESKEVWVSLCETLLVLLVIEINQAQKSTFCSSRRNLILKIFESLSSNEDLRTFSPSFQADLQMSRKLRRAANHRGSYNTTRALRDAMARSDAKSPITYLAHVGLALVLTLKNRLPSDFSPVENPVKKKHLQLMATLLPFLLGAALSLIPSYFRYLDQYRRRIVEDVFQAVAPWPEIYRNRVFNFCYVYRDPGAVELTPLFQCVEHGSVAMLEMLIQQNVDLLMEDPTTQRNVFELIIMQVADLQAERDSLAERPSEVLGFLELEFAPKVSEFFVGRENSHQDVDERLRSSREIFRILQNTEVFQPVE